MPLDDLCRSTGREPDAVHAEIAAGRLPKPSYELHGRGMVPPDYFALVDEAGGVDGLREAFASRYVAAGGVEPVEDEWAGYLSGEYGVCLKRVAPETIARKAELMRTIAALVDAPASGDEAWRGSLRAAVDELDELERPFAEFDRVRFGGPVSRDRLIADVRARYPDVFA